MDNEHRIRANARLEQMKGTHGIKQDEIDILKGLVDKAESIDELRNIIEETASSHDVVNLQTHVSGGRSDLGTKSLEN